MYSDVNLEALKTQARQFVTENDRLMYYPFLEFIETYAAANRMFLGGDLAIARLTGDCEPQGFCDAFYEIFCDNVYPTAQEMVTKLYLQKSPYLSPETIVLSTVVKHRELVISVNARPIARLWGIERIRGQNVAKILPRAPYMPIEFYMVGIYRQLYAPQAVHDWPDFLRKERKLFAKWVDGLAPMADDALDAPRKYDHLAEVLVGKFKGIIIGDYALARLVPVNKTRLQFISDDSPDEIVARIMKALSTNATKISRVYYVNHSLVMPSDFQLTKHTYYAQTSHSTFALCDIYNSTTYELIPLDQGIPHCWVLLKFYFLDLWIDLLIGRPISPHVCMCIKKTRTILGSAPKAPEGYVGFLLSDRAAKKMILNGPRITDFIPAKKISLQPNRN